MPIEATERVLVACPTYIGKSYALEAYIAAYNDFSYPYRGLFMVDNSGTGLQYFEHLRKLKVPCDHVQPTSNWQETFARCWKRITAEALAGGYQWVASIEQDNICPPLALDIMLNVAGYCRAVHVAHSYPWHAFQQHNGVLMGVGCNLILTELLDLIFKQERWHTDAFEGELFAYPQLKGLCAVELHHLFEVRHIDAKEGQEQYIFRRDEIPQFTPGHTTARLPEIQQVAREKEITDEFHKQFYFSKHTWNGSTLWQGVPVFQTPLDMWMLQEIIYQTQPDIIIETGSALGGSALFYASVFKGRVISIDLQQEVQPMVQHERIRFVKGNSVDPEVVADVCAAVQRQRVMVVLDSDHSAEHVTRELALYAPLVSVECYCVVCDTNLGGNPIQNAAAPGPGPMQAVREFLSAHREFEPDKACEKFYMTFFPNGWLKRIR